MFMCDFVCVLLVQDTIRTLCVGLPELDGLVVLQRSRCNDIFCGMTGGAEDGIRVSLQLLYYLFALKIPYVDHVVLAAADNPLHKK